MKEQEFDQMQFCDRRIVRRSAAYPIGSPESLVISDAYHQNRIDISGISLGMKEYLALLFHRQTGITTQFQDRSVQFWILTDV
jgi:hypothetical protein